jgi:hypothetical protein
VSGMVVKIRIFICFVTARNLFLSFLMLKDHCISFGVEPRSRVTL